MNFMHQTACLVVYSIMVNNFASLFNCTPADWASNLMTAPTLNKNVFNQVSWRLMLCLWSDMPLFSPSDSDVP